MVFSGILSPVERIKFRDQLRDRSFVIFRLKGSAAEAVRSYLKCGDALFKSSGCRTSGEHLCLWHNISDVAGRNKSRWFTGLHRLKHRQTYRLRRLGIYFCVHNSFELYRAVHLRAIYRYTNAHMLLMIGYIP